MKKLIPVLLAMVSWSSVAAQAPETVVLKHRNVPGIYVATITMKATQKITTGNARPMEQELDTLLVFDIGVDRPDANGCQEVHMTYRRVKGAVKNVAVSLAYDSDEPDGNQSSPLGSLYKALVGLRMDIVVDRDSKVVRVAGVDKIMEAMAKASPELAATLKGQESQLGDYWFRQILAFAATVSPAKPVARGDAWEVESQQDMPWLGQVALKQTCKLKGVEKSASGSTATVEFAGKGAGKEKKALDMGAGGKMDFDKVEIEQSGTARIDVASGSLMDTNMDQNMVLDATVRRTDGQEVKVSVDQKAKMDITLKPGTYAAPAARP